MVGYDEDVVFLVILDGSAFSCQVPLVIGTCTLGQIINIIKESEFDQLATPWAMIQLAQLLSWCGGVEEPSHEGASGEQVSAHMEMDEVVELNDSVHVGPFQMKILKGKVTELPMGDTHVMVMPLRSSEVKKGKMHLLPLVLQVLHAYTTLEAGN